MHFLITAGGTREYIDPVRFISNASSGKMGYALAQAALKAGHKVTLISASNLQPPVGVEFVGVQSAAQMFAAVKKSFYKCDCLIMAAAVADYTPTRQSKTKIKKSKKTLTIKLKPTADILKWAGKQKLKTKNLKCSVEKQLIYLSYLRKQVSRTTKSSLDSRASGNDRKQSHVFYRANLKLKTPIVVGFALEDKNLKANAEKKLKEKNLDMIIANKPDSIGSEKTALDIKIAAGRWQKLKLTTKQSAAKKVISYMEQLAAQT
jgi:phosphopantothenoylcysteine synthetase/decarboxylase